DTIERTRESLGVALDEPSLATLDAGGLPGVAGAAPSRRRWFTTVMFIDIVDSTRRVARLGDARWLDVAEASEAEGRRIVRRVRGRVRVVAGGGRVAGLRNTGRGVGG